MGKINSKSVYVVNFDTDELVNNAISSLNSNLEFQKFIIKLNVAL